jgi:hypothetical protein
LNKLGIILGAVLLVVAFAVSPIPLVTTLQNPPRQVVIYPNLLLAVPLILLGVLLLLYGATTGTLTDLGQTKAFN